MGITKRAFLKSAAVAFASPAVAGELTLSPSIRPRIMVVGDSRYSESALFADQLTAYQHWFDARQDAAALWYQRLRHRASEHVAIAGMTTAADLHILHELARESGLTLHRQIQHDGRDRTTVHHFCCTGDFTGLGPDLTVAGSFWPTALARHWYNPPLQPPHHGRFPRHLADTPIASDNPGILVSWLLRSRTSSV